MNKILIDEATVKLALDALEFFKGLSLSMKEIERAEEAITALREALAEQPAQQQEPVGEVSGHDWSTGLLYRDLEPGAPLYTTPQPAQRTWVGLTDDEIYMHCPNWLSQEQYKTWVRQIEAAHGIKKNT